MAKTRETFSNMKQSGILVNYCYKNISKYLLSGQLKGATSLVVVKTGINISNEKTDHDHDIAFYRKRNFNIWGRLYKNLVKVNYS